MMLLHWLFDDFRDMPWPERIAVVLLVIVSLLWITVLGFGAIKLLTLPLYL